MALAATASLVAADQLPVGPDMGDQVLSPFYAWSGALPAQPGKLLRQEPLPVALWPDHAGAAMRLLYTSNDLRWRSGIVPVSGILFLPKRSPGPGGWPLLVWAHGTIGMADRCAPSWNGPSPRDKDYINRWLDEGYAVVATDYQGLGEPGPEPYLVWEAEAPSVLDSARAALQADRRVANRMVISGQSQGSGSALGAARALPTYAPELKVRAAIATASVNYMPEPGTPPETHMVGGDAVHFIMYRMLAGGLPPGQSVDALLSAKGKVLMQSIRTACSPRDVVAREHITLTNAFTVSPEKISIMLGSAGLSEPFRAAFPLMIGTGLDDELIPVPRQLTAVKELCEAGNKLVWKAYPKARHGETLTLSFEDARAFVAAAMGGPGVSATCGGDIGAPARPHDG